MELALYQQQQQQLVMTTELRQAIKILQYSLSELKDFLNEEALENPIIDLNESWSEFHSKKNYNKKEIYEYTDQINTTLHDHLLNQTKLLPLKNEEREILEYLILLLDENGYLYEDLKMIAFHFSTTENKVEEILKNRLQYLEPIGVGARDLKECLLLQLEVLDNRNYLAGKIVSDHLDILAQRKWKQLSSFFNVSLKDIQDVFDFIQNLDPRPGSTIGGQQLEYIVPDLIVRKNGQKFDVLINQNELPTFTVNENYYHLLKYSHNNELSNYMMEKYQRFLWIQKSIEQRRITLLKVMSSIIDKQMDFFERGKRFLNPLTLKEIAEVAGVHESTVSRSTNGKYVQTPYGVFELKYFFSSSISSSQNEDNSVSSHTVKEFIKEFIESEDKHKPLSDQKISNMLNIINSINISRRTVAKYREQLNIPSSSVRKRYFNK